MNLPVNLTNYVLWNEDIHQSVLLFDQWYMDFAPVVFRNSMEEARRMVTDTFQKTNNLRQVNSELLKEHPKMLYVLRMCTFPPLSKDRLVGLSGVKKGFIHAMENYPDLNTPLKTRNKNADQDLQSILNIVNRSLDTSTLGWLSENRDPDPDEYDRAVYVIADRLCQTFAEYALRNAQELRQFNKIEVLLHKHGYALASDVTDYRELDPGFYTFHLNIPIKQEGKQTGTHMSHIPVDIGIQPFSQKTGDMPVLIEAKSAGDFTNVNKRRKEEVTKFKQLKESYGSKIRYCLLLGGYFNRAYLEYVSAEGLDWIWEHRQEDLMKLLF